MSAPAESLRLRAAHPAPAAQPRAAAPGLLPAQELARHHAFLELYGRRPRGGEQLIELIEQSGLTGRGGAGFPTARKLRAVREGMRAPVVLANGTEGEPASSKDEVLMWLNPHLVIDGLLIAAETVRAKRLVIGVGRGGMAAGKIARALADREDCAKVELVEVPERFVAGEESALVQLVNGGEAKPTSRRSRPYESGVGGRRTLVQNVETLANLALVARHGGAWFRGVGTEDEPGTALVTVGGVVRSPGVIEVPFGTRLGEIFERCGGLSEPAQAYLMGGYFGSWVAPDENLRLSEASLAPVGASLGARTIVALGASSCGVEETARVVSYMAAQSAGQCGPCVFGLRALAERFESIARCRPEAIEAFGRLQGLHEQIARRGACAHPDGVLRFAASAPAVFAAEFEAHLMGRCSAHSHTPTLPTPKPTEGWR
jgi:NADH:ubiquinone oxidoreductase subunit F (NADH-binding)